MYFMHLMKPTKAYASTNPFVFKEPWDSLGFFHFIAKN